LNTHQLFYVWSTKAASINFKTKIYFKK